MRKTLLALLFLVPACGNSSNPADGGADLATPPDLAPATVFTVFIRGTLKNDLATSKGIHDAIAGAGKAKAILLGDRGHYVFLDVAPPPDGGPPPAPTQLLAIDLWGSLDGLAQFESDPNVQQGFAMLFAAPPEVTVTAHPDGWTEWGTLDPLGQGMPLYLFSVRGALAAATVEQSRTYHDQLAGGTMAMAMQAGDVAHQVRLANPDMKQFQAVDLWKSLAGAQAVYGDPKFQAAFGQLFSGPPTVEPYSATDWAQW